MKIKFYLKQDSFFYIYFLTFELRLGLSLLEILIGGVKVWSEI